jgi:hypothetical protein
MVIYLFRDKSNEDYFAFSTDVTGRNIPLAAATTQWMFIEALNTLKFPEPWDIGDFQYVLDHLRAHGFYLFQGEYIEPAALELAKPSGLMRH